MALTPTKEVLLTSINERNHNDHAVEVERAARLGRQAPTTPAPLVEEHVDWPRYVYKGWKLSAKGGGHYEASESRLVRNTDELKSALKDEWTEAPPPQAAVKK